MLFTRQILTSLLLAASAPADPHQEPADVELGILRRGDQGCDLLHGSWAKQWQPVHHFETDCTHLQVFVETPRHAFAVDNAAHVLADVDLETHQVRTLPPAPVTVDALRADAGTHAPAVLGEGQLWALDGNQWRARGRASAPGGGPLGWSIERRPNPIIGVAVCASSPPPSAYCDNCAVACHQLGAGRLHACATLCAQAGTMALRTLHAPMFLDGQPLALATTHEPQLRYQDGLLLVTDGTTQTTELWDLRSRQRLGALQPHDRPLPWPAAQAPNEVAAPAQRMCTMEYAPAVTMIVEPAPPGVQVFFSVGKGGEMNTPCSGQARSSGTFWCDGPGQPHSEYHVRVQAPGFAPEIRVIEVEHDGCHFKQQSLKVTLQPIEAH